MISVAVKVETECGTCRMPMPVNTLAREVGCQSCGRPTAIGGDLWQALFRDPVYEGPKMLQNEGRCSSASRVSVAFTRRGLCCQGCEKEIPVASIVEVREQAMLRCDRCAKQTWVRKVPAEFAAALPNITHLVGEDPDPLAMAHANAAQAATFPCPQCGSPVPFDGVNRACTCRFCSASVHVPDEFVYRGRRKLSADWFLCFDTSVADCSPVAQAVAAGLFDWDEPPVAAVDAEGNLYCAARQTHCIPVGEYGAKEKIDNVLWSLDPSMNVRWLQRGRSRPVHLALSPKGMLLVSARGRSSQPWLSSRTGWRIEAADGTTAEIDGDLLDCDDLTCASDGSLLILKDDILRRISPSGEEMSVRSGGAARGLPPTERLGGLKRICCGPDGSIFCLYRDEIVRIDVSGRSTYRVEFSSDAAESQYRTLGADLNGNVYVLRSEQLVRISATGEAIVLLKSKRDKLPRAEMSIAVCPDGSFWLFGPKGSAWRFDSSVTLAFASEKESRPTKVTIEKLLEQQRTTSAAKAESELQEQLRLIRQRKATEEKRTQMIAVVGAAVLIALFVLLMVAVR
ncbi:hypothetical protein WME76_09210 [Sorangium sp. So ce119]|uniref:hypothetical protein n=1 Tax=Sorangium sp. So ce119 TaxID=3133279 RepID=UPI003F606C64